MKRRQALRLALGLGALAGTSSGGAAALHWERRALLGFGTTLSLQAGHEHAATARRALDAAVAALRRIEAQMNLFDADSALARLNRDGELRDPPPELLAVLRIAQRVSQCSGGAFDVTVQPLWEAWARAQREGRLPSPQEVAAARARVDWRALDLGPERLRFTAPGRAATLNGIARGYAAERVRGVLAAQGIRHALVDVDGFAPLGRNADDQPWALGIADPRAESALLARLLTDGRCVCTSADSQTFFSPDYRHHHIFDPRTGYSPPQLSSVTVAAPSGALADALTKVFFMAGPAQAREVARQWQVDALWVDKAGRWEATPGLRI
ncbi:MAG: FAD:protein FMN transferase [Methylibium sp.]|jgi:FAD:protein FMN transferase|nr:FAD:protein FMN transferase [Methylibium sp.]